MSRACGSRHRRRRAARRRRASERRRARSPGRGRGAGLAVEVMLLPPRSRGMASGGACREKSQHGDGENRWPASKAHGSSVAIRRRNLKCDARRGPPFGTPAMRARHARLAAPADSSALRRPWAHRVGRLADVDRDHLRRDRPALRVLSARRLAARHRRALRRRRHLDIFTLSSCSASPPSSATSSATGSASASGPKIFKREDSWFFNKKHARARAALLREHGGKTIIIARFIPIIRTFAPVVAGVGKMEYRKFVAFNVVGGLTWVWALTLAGYGLGGAFRTSKRTSTW